MVTVIKQMIHGPLAQSILFQVHAANPQPAGRRSRVRSIVHHLGRLVELWRVLGQEAFDVVHIHTCSGFTFYRNLADAALSALSGSAVVLHIHGGRFERFCIQAGFLGRWIIRMGLTRADRVVVLSPSWARRLSRFAPRARFEVVPNAVAAEPCFDAHDASNSHRCCRFVFLGPITRAKGVDVLLRASAELVRRGLDFHLTLAGPAESGRDALDLPALLNELGMHGHVDPVGTVIGSQKSALLARSDCLVLPSLAEGMPLSVLEAGARGLAVIATNVGAVPEMLGDSGSGCVVPPGDILALADRMIWMAADPDRPKSVGSRLRQRVLENYSLDHQARILSALYEELARTGNPSRSVASLAAGGTMP
ncbi:MAG: glycosyltransferase family 4 protein [Phycisphaerae bacterium]